MHNNFFGALIGGIVAYRIARKNIKYHETQLREREEKDNEEKQIQLLWKIYFDIKSDCENSKLLDKKAKLLECPNNMGTPLALDVEFTLTYINRDLCNFFKILSGKENQG